MQRTPVLITLIVAMAILVHPGTPSAQVFEGHWSTEYYISGTNPPPTVIIEHQGQFVLGGNFTRAGNFPYRFIVKSNGSNWTPFATGIPNAVAAIVHHDGTLIALTSGHRRLWRLEGDHWIGLSQSLGSGSTAMASYAGNLYIGGSVWNGSELVDFLQANGTVNALTVYQNQLVIGGAFTACGTDTLGGLVAWDGAQVSRPWPDLGLQIRHLSANSNKLVAIGGIPGWQAPFRVYQFAGTDWQHLQLPNSGPEYEVASFTLWHGGELFAAYVLYGWDWNIPIFRRWTGTQWAVVAGSGSILSTAASTSTGIVLGGDALRHGSTFLGTVARRPNAAGEGSLVQVGPTGYGATGGGVYSIQVGHDGVRVVGGNFRSIGNRIAVGVARDFGSSWHAMSFSPETLEYAHVANAYLHPEYGAYATVVGAYTRHLYRWNSFSWDFHPNLPGLVAIEHHPNFLNEPFGASESVIYQLYSGTVLGTASEGVFKDLHYWQDSLVAGGSVTRINNTTVSKIARLVGSQWQAFPAPLAGTVTKIADWNGQLVIAGQGLDPNGPNVWRVAVWTGSTWSLLGGAFNAEIRALTGHENHLYAGGAFTNVDGVSIKRLAGWDGHGWRPVGDGCNSDVNALLSHQGRLWIGGQFSEAGGQAASCMTNWAFQMISTDVPPDLGTELTLHAPVPNPFNPTTNVSYSLPRGADVNLAIHDLRGRVLRVLVQGFCSEGTHTVAWHGTDDHGRPLSSGVYLVRLRVGDRVENRKVSLIR